jgi:hypothetical protein
MGAWKTSIAAALAGLLLLGGVAQAQVPDPFARDLAQNLARVDAAVSNDGFMRAAGPFAGGITRADPRRVTLSLRAGQDYLVVGVCDARCGGLDLTLAGPGGAPSARGAPQHGASMMRVRVGFTGPYEVGLDAPRCVDTPCWYAVNVYSR